MTTCFCGCLEEIGLFERDRRRANESGEKISRSLEDVKRFYEPWLNAGLPGMEAIPIQPDLPSYEEDYREMFGRGTRLRDSCLATVHQIPGAETPARKAIKTWLGEAEFLIFTARMPPDLRKRYFDALADLNGEETAEIWAEAERAIKAADSA